MFYCTDTATVRLVSVKPFHPADEFYGWHFQSHYTDLAEAKQQLKLWQQQHPENLYYLTAADPLKAMFSCNPPAAIAG